ncbi:uncharacterized protein PODANS_4_2950 [Podospora anserina S mat+]|uniref:Podospora anserina S mat+ genomic DNA chromosome 4, supercontig 2 n=1 Tax=Podospora anserina (strain S / ATCC MYA-4624 / DSM 980 / FGSC 10383) TaxID=515849 RepID=B2AE60_PODAN|nr:uncharacterized protein PODANS_4_2950 [Podospora anserina S mat+]CAP61726.1 unnamed protein product [Podospora anserina S mat+]CDP28074.1 Putative protein of unknown function [Podospora anserina S mat+]
MRFIKTIAMLAAMGSDIGIGAASVFRPTKPPAVPLAVRSPYLNAWLQGESGCVLPGEWPRFWTGDIQGWQGYVAVDGVAYNWMGGAPGPGPVNQLSLEYTSTKSIFTFDVAQKITLTVTFLSPVYPDDIQRQSLQFSYVTVTAKSSDGASHKVQVYMDVSGEWASGDNSEKVQWEFGTESNLYYLKFWRENQHEFKEANEIASWGNWYLSTGFHEGLTWQIGQDTTVRNQFAGNLTLSNSQESEFRPVSENWPVFAFSHDLGDIKDDEVERIFTLGLIQDNVIHFARQNNTLEPVRGLWMSFYNNSDMEAVVSFYNDYRHAVETMSLLDQRIEKDSVEAAGQNYSLITTLALRQTFGAFQYAGTPEKPYIFLKEISSNSDIQTVDVIFPAFPIFVYLNATLSRYLLDPLFEHQESGSYPNKYAEHDLGTFPVAKGYPNGDDEAMPLEECGNMIIMSLAYAQRTGDTGYLTAHYPILAQWAQYLIEDSLVPANQLSTDDFAGTLANQTNLAIKGIIGLKAMSQIAQLTNNTDDFKDKAEDYLMTWKAYAINYDASPPHTTLSYGDKDSHGILYNIYADRLLGLQFVDQSVFDMQSDFYLTVANEYAVPLDTRHTWAKSDWEMFAAAVAKNETKEMFIDKLAEWVGKTTTNRAMTDLFDSITGDYPSGGPTFVARPVMGGMFALLALPKE